MTLAPALLLALATSPGPAEFAGVQPQLSAVGRRVALVFGEGQNIYFAGSRDGGRTFTSPVLVPSRGNLALGRRRGPRVAIVGNAVVVTAILATELGAGDLFAWRSTDDGRSWSAPLRLNRVVASAREGLHGLGGSGQRVTAAWLDLRAPGTHLWSAISNDAGATWAEDRQVYDSPSGTICQCCHPSVAISPKGEISLMFRNSLDGARDMYLTTSHDGGQSFAAATKLGDGTWKLEGCPMDGGGLAVDGRAAGGIVSVWQRERGIFLAGPGRPEQRLAAGRDPAIALGRDDWAVAFRDDDGVCLINGKNPEKQILASGAEAPVLVALDDGTWVAGWQRDGRVFVLPVTRGRQ
jgi:BNR repeat-like domain